MKKTVVLIILFFISTVVFAEDVFINGVKVTGIKSQEIKKSSIKIDDKGDIYITAPDIKILDEKTTVTKEYYVAVSFDKPSPVDVTFILNGKPAGKVTKGQKDTFFKLENKLKKGENTLGFNAPPSKEKGSFKVSVGSGKKVNNNIEFIPVADKSADITEIGVAGTFKFNAE